MAFLTWRDEQLAEDSLAAINTAYGCPYVAENGYRMDRWDFVIPSNDNTDYGFYKPEERLDQTMDALMPVLMQGFIEHDEMPEDFKPEEE